MARSTKDQLIELARENIRVLTISANRHPDHPVIAMDLQLAKISLAELTVPQLPQHGKAVQVPEELLSTMEEVLRISDRDHEFWHKAKEGIAALRAAMLQGADRPQNEPQNIPENIPTLREAVDTIRSSGISIDAEKILAERDALNSPVIPDGWKLVPIDITPVQMRSLQINSELGAFAASNLSGAYSLFREFWSVALSEAPKPEVK